MTRCKLTPEKKPADCTMALEPFSDAPVCPKCGAQSVSSRFCPGACKSPSDLCQVNTRHQEHLTRICMVCAYAWQEATKSASAGVKR